MLYSIEKGEDFEKVEELASSHNQIEELRLQDKSSKQNFHENIKEIY